MSNSREDRGVRLADCQSGEEFARTWKRPPNEEELRGLIENYIRDEVFYRAGRAAGLDRDDVVSAAACGRRWNFLPKRCPSRTHRRGACRLSCVHQERFRTEDSLTFRQVFLSASRRAGTIDVDAEQLAAALSAAGAEADTAELWRSRSSSARNSAPSRCMTWPRRSEMVSPSGPLRRSRGLARTDRIALWAAFRLYRRTDQGRACRRSTRSGRRSLRKWASARRIEAEAEALPVAA